MNVLSKVGFALVAFGGLIFAGVVIWGFIQLFIHVSIPWYIQVAVTAIILGFILMFLSALYDRYKTVKTEEVHEKI
jgi:hypothetical protein